MAGEEDLTESLSKILKSREYKITENKWMRVVRDIDKERALREREVNSLLAIAIALVFISIVMIIIGLSRSYYGFVFIIIGVAFFITGIIVIMEFISSKRKKASEEVNTDSIPEFFKSGKIVTYSSTYQYNIDDSNYFFSTVVNNVLSSLNKLLFDIRPGFRMVEHPERRLTKRFIVKEYSFVRDDIPVMVNFGYLSVEKVNFFMMGFEVSVPEIYENEYSEIVEKIKLRMSEEMKRILK